MFIIQKEYLINDCKLYVEEIKFFEVDLFSIFLYLPPGNPRFFLKFWHIDFTVTPETFH